MPLQVNTVLGALHAKKAFEDCNDWKDKFKEIGTEDCENDLKWASNKADCIKKFMGATKLDPNNN